MRLQKEQTHCLETGNCQSPLEGYRCPLEDDVLGNCLSTLPCVRDSTFHAYRDTREFTSSHSCRRCCLPLNADLVLLTMIIIFLSSLRSEIYLYTSRRVSRVARRFFIYIFTPSDAKERTIPSLRSTTLSRVVVCLDLVVDEGKGLFSLSSPALREMQFSRAFKSRARWPARRTSISRAPVAVSRSSRLRRRRPRATFSLFFIMTRCALT